MKPKEQIRAVETTVVKAEEPPDGTLLMLRQTAQCFRTETMKSIIGRHRIHLKILSKFSLTFYPLHRKIW